MEKLYDEQPELPPCPPELVGNLVELPLPEGLLCPPDGFTLIDAVKSIDILGPVSSKFFQGLVYFSRGEWNIGSWAISRNIAVPSHWITRAKPARYRVHVESGQAPKNWHTDREKAIAEAQRLASLPDVLGSVYVYKVEAEFAAEKVVRRVGG